MGRKKAIVNERKEKKAIQDADNWDGMSTASSSTTWTTCAEDFDKRDDTVDHFQTSIDQLFEPRYTTREKALAWLLQFMRADVHEEECSENSSTITARCLNGLKRGGPTEAALSAQVLGMHFLSIPQPDESLFQEVQPDLQRAITGTGEVRSTAIETLSMVCFVASGDDDATSEVMDKLRKQWERGDAKGRVCALRGWSLLFTSLSSLPSGSVVEDLLAQLARLLHTVREAEVRAAVGEAVGLLVHCCGLSEMCMREANRNDDDWEEEEEEEDLEEEGGGEGGLGGGEEEKRVEENGGEAGAHREGDSNGHEPSSSAQNGHGGGSSSQKKKRGGRSRGQDAGGDKEEEGEREGEGLASVMGRMRELAVAGKKRTDVLRHGRRDKAQMRTAFRSVLGLIESSEVTPIKIKLPMGDVLVVDTLRATVTLNAFRRMLAGGFQVHLQRNTLLHDVFSFTPSSSRPERMSALEKRYFKSPNSIAAKSRTADRKGARLAKAVMI